MHVPLRTFGSFDGFRDVWQITLPQWIRGSVLVLHNRYIVKRRGNEDRTTLLALIFGIARTGVPLRIKAVPWNSPIIEAVQLAYEGRGMVVVCPSRDRSTVTISTYPTSVRGVSALAAEVFRNGFKHIRSRYRLNIAA